MAIRILHLDGDPGFHASVKSLLESEGMDVLFTPVRSGHEYRKALAADAFDLILAEYPLPDFAGVSALKQAPSSVPSAGFSGLRILVAEDNTVNQVVVTSLLEALGCDSPEVVGDGRGALAAFRGKEFDIIFMDCQMPELDGYAATARIRRMEARAEAKGGANRRCYIAAVTADILPDVEEKCRAAGMDWQLTKPYIIEDLVATLERARMRAAAGGFQAARPSRRPYGGDGGDGGTGASRRGRRGVRKGRPRYPHPRTLAAPGRKRVAYGLPGIGAGLPRKGARKD